ncbi:helix-turn-helix domain-containing protein [Alcanivorax sp. VBW004]|uniref:AraC family transcriptional regulator n=1 Tax=Alcanivorax sp. VBW004 TaxID=1287708 RepID=UPI0012BB8DA5|nr:helix-turn-helix domain-containing protein [Alcanivorax sp. VBW004]
MTSKAIVGSYVLVLADLLDRRGLDSKKWLRDSGLEPSSLDQPRQYLDIQEVTNAIRTAVKISHDPALGLYFGQQLNLNTHGLLGVVGLLSSNVGDSLEAGFRYSATRSPLVDLRLTESGNDAIIHIALNTDVPDDIERFTLESLIYSFGTMAHFLFPGDIPPVTVEVSIDKPPHAELYSILYRSPLTIRFNAHSNRIIFPNEVLKRPLPLANLQTRKLVEKEVSEELALLTGDSEQENDIISRVRKLITEMPGYYPSMDEVAERLAMTKRTLHRHIEKSGTNFKKLTEEIRFKDASHYLNDTDLSVTQISHLLGYNDSSNFTRAFHRWSGFTPLQYRKKSR